MKTKNFLNRTLSILLCMVMLLTVFMCVPFTANAQQANVNLINDMVTIGNSDSLDNKNSADGEKADIADTSYNDNSRYEYENIIQDGVVYSIDESGYLYLTGYKDSELPEHLVIPKEVNGYPLEDIWHSAFQGSTKLKSVVIPNTIKRDIDDYVFRDCVNLESVVFEEGIQIKYLGEWTFAGCKSLKSITIPASVEKVVHYTFEDCTSLKTVTFEENSKLEEIGMKSFYNCTSLETIDIPSTCLEIRSSAFMNCESLYEVNLKSGLKEIGEKAFFNCFSLYYITIPKSVESIGSMALGCFEEDGVNYSFGDFVVVGVKSSLADEYADVYNVYWALSAPKLTKISNTSSGVKITFSKPSGASSGKYEIYRCTESTEWKKIGTTSSLSYTDKTAKAGKKYYYTVQFIGKPTNSLNDLPLEIVRLTNPSVSKITNTTTGAKITWSKVTGAAEYKVYVKSGSSWKTLGSTSGTSYTHTSAASGKNYTYTVKAYDSSGEYVSGYKTAGWSNKFVASPKIKSISNTSTGAKITWGKVSGAAKYRVFVKSGDSWKKLKDTTSTSYTHTGLTSGKTYTYTVRCISSTGKSYTSSYDTTGTKNTYVKRPSISKITNTVDGPKLSWSKVAGATKYNVYVKSGSSWKLLGCADSTSFVHETATSGKTYTYTLRCADSDGKNISAYNSTGWQNKYIAAPVITSLENTSKGVKITWDKVSGAAKYRVFVKSGDSWKKLKDTTSTSYTHTGLSSGKTYTYTVRCISSTGKSYTSSYDAVGQAIVFEK